MHQTEQERTGKNGSGFSVRHQTRKNGSAEEKFFADSGDNRDRNELNDDFVRLGKIIEIGFELRIRRNQGIQNHAVQKSGSITHADDKQNQKRCALWAFRHEA